MLATASRKLERTGHMPPYAPAETSQGGINQAKAAVAELTERLANHRRSHGC
jgi:hypothetical protein